MDEIRKKELKNVEKSVEKTLKKVQPVCKKWAAFIYDILLAEVDSSIRALAVARKTLRSDSEHWEISNSRSLYADVVRSWGKMQESADMCIFRQIL